MIENSTSDVAAALRRLDAVAEHTNCVADRADEVVLAAEGDAADGVLAGEPITVKDWIDVAGFRCSGGEVDHVDRRPEVDATAVARLRAAGAVVIAKTAVQVDSARFGPVFHPIDPTRSPGGSSSGEGATVGGGVVRLGIGSDSGGSVRVPAAWCGVIGMKPSAGLVPVTGHFPPVGSRGDGRTVIGPLATSVDLAWRAVLTMAGPDGADAAVPPVALGDPRAVELSSLRVAIGVPAGGHVSRVMGSAVDWSRAVLVDAGVADAGDPPDWLARAKDVTERYWSRWLRSGAEVDLDLFEWDDFRRWGLDQTAAIDVIVTPTVSDVAPVHRDMTTEDYLYCLPPSLTGAPAISVPVVGGAVQVIARRWDDHVAIAVAMALEAANERRPARG